MGSIRKNLLFQLCIENVACFTIKIFILKIIGTKKERKTVFEQMVAKQLIFKVIGQNIVLRIESVVDLTVFDIKFREELDPVDPAERDRKRFQTIFDLMQIPDIVINQFFPDFGFHLLLHQKFKIVQIVCPQFSVAGIVPVDLALFKCNRKIQKSKMQFFRFDVERGI